MGPSQFRVRKRGGKKKDQMAKEGHSISSRIRRGPATRVFPSFSEEVTRVLTRVYVRPRKEKKGRIWSRLRHSSRKMERRGPAAESVLLRYRERRRNMEKKLHPRKNEHSCRIKKGEGKERDHEQTVAVLSFSSYFRRPGKEEEGGKN